MYTLWINGSATEEFEDFDEALEFAASEWRLLGNESIFIVDDESGEVTPYGVNWNVNFETPDCTIYCGGCVEERKLFEALPLNQWGSEDNTPPWATCFACEGRLYEPCLADISFALARAKERRDDDWVRGVLCPSLQEDRQLVRDWLEDDLDGFNLDDFCGY